MRYTYTHMATKKWLILILIVAALFRFIRITLSPPALNWDEISIGYNAYSILQTGRDEWGKFMPLSFEAFGENKLPGMIYASIPAIALFGLTDFGVRATPAILGILAVYLVYLLAKELFKNEQSSLITAALMAISPWAVHFSRVSFEAGLALAAALASLIFLLRAHVRPRLIWWSMLFAVISVYSYNSLRILLPLLFIAYWLNGVIKLTLSNRKAYLSAMIVGLLLCLPIVVELANASGRVRLGTVAIQSQKSFTDGVAESRGYTTLPAPIPQAVHNKYTHYVYTLSMNYIKTFSTEFLFLEGSGNTQRSVQGMGMLYLFELPLLIAGLASLRSQKPIVSRLLIPWLLLAPIPSAITIDAPSSVRLYSLLPALLLLESMGAITIYRTLVSRKLALLAVGVFALWNVSYFLYLLHFVTPVKYSSAWQYGYKQAILYADSLYDTAERIYLPAKYGEPYIYTLFYSKYDPAKFQAGPVERETDPTGWIHVKSFDKYIFSDFAGLEAPLEIVARNRGSLVLITPFATLPGQYNRDFTLKAPNWEVMFEGTVQQGLQ